MKKLLFFITAKSYGVYINLACFIAPKKTTLLAYSLFSNPRKGRLDPARLPAFLNEVEKETFEQNGQAIQTYIWKGDEKIIFLIHGWESNTSRWKKLIPQLLSTGHTLVAIDAPAHGLSGGKEFNVLLHASYMDCVAKKYSPNYIIAHSIGGKTSLYYQSTYQNPSVEKIVLLGTPSDFKILFENYIKILGLNSRIVHLLHQHYWDHFRVRVAQFSAVYFVTNIKAKGFVIHDLDDPVVLYNESEKITRHWKTSVLETTKGFGHSLQSNEVYKKILGFLAESN